MQGSSSYYWLIFSAEWQIPIIANANVSARQQTLYMRDQGIGQIGGITEIHVHFHATSMIDEMARQSL